MHRDALNDTCIVHEDINLTHLFMNLLHEGLHGILVRNVAHVTLHVLDTSLFVVVQATLQGSLIDVVENNGLDTSAYKSLGDVETDTIGSACYPGILSLK